MAVEILPLVLTRKTGKYTDPETNKQLVEKFRTETERQCEELDEFLTDGWQIITTFLSDTSIGQYGYFILFKPNHTEASPAARLDAPTTASALTYVEETPLQVVNGLEYVRGEGRVNMFDRRGVIERLREVCYDTAADWIESHDHEAYGKALMELQTGGEDSNSVRTR